jgi:hypothetical protein
MNKGRMRAGVEMCLRPRLIERCCEKGIERIQKEEGRELVEHHLDCGYTSMCVLLGKLQVMEELEGGLGRVVWMMREEKNLVNEVLRSIVKLGQCREWGTTRRVHLEKILKIQ